MSAPVHDLVGVGIGPFNLGLACLADPVPGLDAVFLDQRDEFSWHPGMMIDGATIQVPFMADLVTMADPTSRYSFLAFLKETGRLYPFYIRESFYPLRAEYDAYGRWAARRLSSLRWRHRVTAVEYDAIEDVFTVRALTPDGPQTLRTRNVVMGIGTEPWMPSSFPRNDPRVVHSAGYLRERDRLATAGTVTIVGSGQSAAEIYRDLLDRIDDGQRLEWITRSPRFFPMEYTKLTLELTSPEYTDHFHALPLEVRDRLNREQRSLYKGISSDLVDDIHHRLYARSVAGPVPTTLLADTAVERVGLDADGVTLDLRNGDTGAVFSRRADVVVAATGYRPRPPDFLAPVEHLIRRDAGGRLAVGRDYAVDVDQRRIFVQNAEEHTHGLTAPDLGFGAYRNSVILAQITGREIYPVERRIAFQEFCGPAPDRAWEPAGGNR